MMTSTPEISLLGPEPSTPPFLYLNPHFTPRHNDSDESLELGVESTSTPPTNCESLPTNDGSDKKDKVVCLLCSKRTNAQPNKHMHKFVRKLLHHVRSKMENLSENPEDYPFCPGCEELMQTVWFGYQKINEGINGIQGKVAEVALARMQAGHIKVPTETDGGVKLLEALLEVFCRNLSFREKIRELERGSGSALTATSQFHGSAQGGASREQDDEEEDESDEEVDIMGMDESEEEVENSTLLPVEGQGQVEGDEDREEVVCSFNTNPTQAQLMFGTVTAREERPPHSIAGDDGDKPPQNLLPSPKLNDVRTEANRKRRRKNTRNPYKIKKRSSPKSVNGSGEGAGGNEKTICPRLLRNKANLPRRKSCFCCAKMELRTKKKAPTGTPSSNRKIARQ